MLCAAGALLASGCAGRPQAPIIESPGINTAATAARLEALLPTDVLLLGEQHDAAEHQQIHQQVIALLSARGLLGAVALEMADVGVSTAALQPRSTEAQVQDALKWNDKGWPWAAYGPAVMTAVRAGVPVMGANLPRAQMQSAMADGKLDVQLPGPALKAQQQLIRTGHCNLLPESRITPMARIQIAKDVTMANTLAQAALPGKVVLLLAGSGHVDRNLGVPQHLPADLKSKTVRLRAGGGADFDKADEFDSVWSTPALPDTDHCADLRK
ncbi:ChaN family lipoprotein [Polaromonas sp. P1(28)-13]|nr:ChaN family lipoprotein [Polaromonas sp. P1(28)-13]